VWTLEKGTLVRRRVTPAGDDQAANRVEVTQGLQADQTVLGARFDNLKEGAPARIAGAGAGASGPGAPAAQASPVRANAS